jgi:hypothetical protein
VLSSCTTVAGCVVGAPVAAGGATLVGTGIMGGADGINRIDNGLNKALSEARSDTGSGGVSASSLEGKTDYIVKDPKDPGRGLHLRALKSWPLYVSVRGWLECDRLQLFAVKEVIAKHADDHYSGGWGFPIHPFNWTAYVCYGGDIQEGDIPWLRDQLAEMAVLSPEDKDDSDVQGLFMLTHEGEGLTEWQIRNKGLHELSGAGRHQHLGSL